MSLIVTKFGGSVFKARNNQTVEDSYGAVAEHLKRLNYQYDKVVAVVSAAYGISDWLIELVAGEDKDSLQAALLGEIDGSDYNQPEVAYRLASGEFDSVDRLVEASGNSFSRLTQLEPNFPLRANSSYLHGTVEYEDSQSLARQLNLGRGVTVVSGYAGRDYKGKVVLLGRNASDLVAAWFAALFSADVLRYYKDQPGRYQDFGTSESRLVPILTRKEWKEMGLCKLLDQRALEVPYFGNIEFMELGGDKPGTVIYPNGAHCPQKSGLKQINGLKQMVAVA